MPDILPAYSAQGEGYPLVLLHGNGEDRTYFDGQIGAFAACRRVIAVDTRGHGQTPRGTAPFTLAQFAEDVCALLDTLSIPRADVLGYSDGGNIALLFALRHPARVRRMVLNGANLNPLGLCLPTLLAVECTYAALRVASLCTNQARAPLERYALMAVQPHIHPAALAALPHPTLVLAGTRDVIRRRHTRLIARMLPAGRPLLLPGGHAIAREHPAAYNAAVLAFLREADSEPTFAQ